MTRIALFLLLALWECAAYAQSGAPTSKTCDCPPPTAAQISAVCAFVYDGSPATNENWLEVGFRFQEELWKMSCATPGVDTREQAAVKIQCMWNKYRESFRCYGYTGTMASDKNIVKFATDIDRYEVLRMMLRHYQLDMNFRDPADGKSVLDYVLETKARIENEVPRNENRILAYEKMAELLIKHGAKRSRDLAR